MEDPRWLRLMTIGLVLAALAVGYFLFSGRLAPSKTARMQASPAPTVLGKNAQVSPRPSVVSSASPRAAAASSVSPSPTSAFERAVSRAQTGSQSVETLPRTGFPVELAAAFSISAVISGWGLRRFPH